MMGDIQGLQASILNEYSKSIDVSTILAILSDYDLGNPDHHAAARQTLDILKETVPNDEATGFDPSGASGPANLNPEVESGRADEESASARSGHGWRSQTDDTSISQEMRYLDLEGLDFSGDYIPSSGEQSPENEYTSELDKLDEEGKEKALVGIFPALKPFDVKWTLKKCKGNASLAIDELMTQSFLEESGGRHRGIEAFSESELRPRPRKGKGKKKKTQVLPNINTDVPASPVESKWDTARQDIDFITSRTGIPTQQITSLYHNNGGSVQATICAIMESHRSLNLEYEDNPIAQINVFELHEEFPKLPTSDLEILVQLTLPSLPDARELAKALVTRPESAKPPIQVELRHTPIKLEPEFTPVKARAHNAVNPNRPLDANSAFEEATKYTEARNTAFMKAAAAYKKGKSDHLMGGAAAYYAEQGRDFDFRAKSAESAAADVLVASQSTRTELDLHGCNVKDAVRIAKEGVTTWWHELGETRIGGKGIGAGYRIVVGGGKHSEGGRSKLGPPVGKMLINDGWKVQVSNVAFTVTGVAQRR